MGGNRPAQGHGGFHLALDEFKAFQFDLSAADIQAGDDLVVRRGRRVGHVGFMERLLDLPLEVLVVDMNHRSLPQRRECLMG